MRPKRFLMKTAAILIGIAVVTTAVRDRFGAEALPVADDCLSASGINTCEADLVVLSGDDPDGRRIWLRPGRALPRAATPPFHVCRIPNLPAKVPHKVIPGATEWGCILPPRLRD